MIEGEARAEELWQRFGGGLVNSVLYSVLFSESLLILLLRFGRGLDSGEMGARPPQADSVRE